MKKTFSIVLLMALLAQPVLASPILSSEGASALLVLMLIVSLVAPVTIALLMCLLQRAAHPALPQRWLATLLLAVLTWFGSLGILFNIEHQGSQPSTGDWWAFFNILATLALTIGVAGWFAFRTSQTVVADEN